VSRVQYAPIDAACESCHGPAGHRTARATASVGS
jgi:hypothetical protein